jgi:general secretion pathway protein F
MPVFQYKGFDSKGKATSGVKDADNPRALRTVLRREGILLTDVKESGVGQGRGPARGQKPRPGESQRNPDTLIQAISNAASPGQILAWINQRGDADPQVIAVLTRQLATLLRAGVQLSESLAALVDQAEREGLKRVLSDVKIQINEGLPLSAALGRHPRFFPDLYINLVSAGEAAGNLEGVLFRLADFMEAQNKLRSKVLTALFYPLVMTVLGGGILILLMNTVVPKVTSMYADSGRALPINTQILIYMSLAMTDYWWVLIPVVFSVVYFVRRWLNSPGGRYRWDRLVLRLPIFGPLTRMVAVSRFAKTLATMLASGVQLLRAMEIVKNVLGNEVLTKVVEEARESIREGESIAQPLRRSGEFPPVVCHMIAVGERSGQLETMLENVAAAYDVEVDMKIARLTTLLEPLMILFMGGAVGFVVFSILMPIMEMNEFVQ